MQPQCRPKPYCSTSVLLDWQRAAFCIVMLALMMLTIIGNGYPVHARHTPGQRDRRPDREVRIRYPQPQRPSREDHGSRATVQRATAAPSAPDVEPVTESAGVTQPIPTAGD